MMTFLAVLVSFLALSSFAIWHYVHVNRLTIDDLQRGMRQLTPSGEELFDRFVVADKTIKGANLSPADAFTVVLNSRRLRLIAHRALASTPGSLDLKHSYDLVTETHSRLRAEFGLYLAELLLGRFTKTLPYHSRTMLERYGEQFGYLGVIAARVGPGDSAALKHLI